MQRHGQVSGSFDPLIARRSSRSITRRNGCISRLKFSLSVMNVRTRGVIGVVDVNGHVFAEIGVRIVIVSSRAISPLFKLISFFNLF